MASALPDPTVILQLQGSLREGQNQRKLPETVPCRIQKESTTSEEQVIRRMSLYKIVLISFLISSSSSEERKFSVMLAKRFYRPRGASLNCIVHNKNTWGQKKRVRIKVERTNYSRGIQSRENPSRQHTTFSSASIRTRSSGGISKGRDSQQQNRQAAFSAWEKWPSPYQ